MPSASSPRLSVKARELLDGGPAPDGVLLAAQFAGAKAHLRAIHDALVATAGTFGADVTVVDQKTAVSLRRRKQFAVVKAASSKRLELGLNLPEPPADDRVTETAAMCSHRVDLTEAADLDAAVTGWLKQAYDAAG